MISDRETYLDCNPAALEMFGFSCKPEFKATPPAALSPRQQPDGADSAAAARSPSRNWPRMAS